MIHFPSRLVASVFASIVLAGSALAQSPTTPAPTPPASASTKMVGKPPVVRTEASLECSKEADAKGLHGKERKKFRSDCKKTGAKPK